MSGGSLRIAPNKGSFEFGMRESAAQPRAASATPSSSVGMATPNPNLSSIEVEQMLRENIRRKYHDIKQACQNYDIDQSLSITKGEIRRVLDNYCLPLTTAQFDAMIIKVPANPNGTINYCTFIDRFAGTGEGSKESWKMGSGHRYSYTKSPQDMGIDVLERQLREKIAANSKNFIKALHLFDYNRDGCVQKHEMRKVIENYCFRTTDEQYDRLWARYDFHHSGMVNYHDFLQRLGINVKRHDNNFPESTKIRTQSQRLNDRDKRVERMAVVNHSDDAVKGLNYQQIEAQLRRRMRENYVNIKKVFMAFDAKQDGYVTLEDLKSILNSFTVPMSDQLFHEVMDHVGFKASHKIPWEHFLEKFQKPRLEGNGSTIPIKCNHKVNPIREAEENMPAEEMLKLLKKHVNNMHTSIKSAFLAFDENRDGKVTRKELRKVLEKFTFRMTEDQFRDLCSRLDPDHVNFIDYHAFLELFEERETKEGHKWLDSEHRWNSVPAPATLAWDTIEEIVREKIEEQWKPISKAIIAADPQGTGALSYRALKNILDQCVVPLSGDHFQKLWGQCEETTNGKVMVGEFLKNLKVDVSPGDLVGTSTMIHVLSDLAEQQRQHDLDSRLHHVQLNALERTGQMTVEEVRAKLQDRMAQKSSSIRNNFLRYCKDRKGRLTQKEFRQVLNSFGMYMDDLQFNELCSRLGFTQGPLTYSDFAEAFEDLRIWGPGAEIQHMPNHDPIRLEAQSMSAEEVEPVLKDKMRQGFGSLRAAFYKLDDDHNGLVSREDFRRLLDGLMFVMTDAEFIKLMNGLSIKKRTKLNYREFLEKFETRDTPEGHKWLDSDHRFNEVIDPAQLAADQVHEILVAKSQRQYHDLAKAFRSLDKQGNGVVTKKELRDMLYTFMIPMTKKEFTNLWRRYDPDGKGYIDHQHFLYMMGKAFAPGDESGTSKRIVEDSYNAISAHHQNQLEKHMNITINTATNAAFISAARVEQALKDKMRDKYASFQDAFNKIDTNKTGYIGLVDLQKVLIDNNFLVDDDTFNALIEKVGIKADNGSLSYTQFLKAFDEGQEEKFRGSNQPEIRPESFSQLAPEKAIKKIRKNVMTNLDVLQSAFGAFDRDKIGRIAATDFRRVLDNFCFKLSDKQFKLLMSKVKVHSDLTISYPAFLDDFSANEQEMAETWIDSIQKSDKVLPPRPVTLEEVHQELLQAVLARPQMFNEAFSAIDYANIGVVSKEDFRMVINEVAFRLSDEQFQELWDSLDINEFGNLEYQEFLSKYGGSEPSPVMNGGRGPTALSFRPATMASVNGRPNTMGSGRSGTRMSMHSSAGRRLFTPLVNAENAEQRLRNKVMKHWKEIQRLCRLHDIDNSGEIESSVFRDIIEQFNISIPEEDFMQLLTKYDLQENGRFAYLQFLKHFVLNLQPSIPEEGGDGDRLPLTRPKLQSSKVLITPGSISTNMVEAMLRVRDCVTKNWKKMRRTFRAIDPTAQGVITSLEFRGVLRQYNINLSEEEFFHLMTYYDKKLEGKVSYNDFLRAFLN